MSSFTQPPQWPSWAYAEASDPFSGYQQQQQQQFPNYTSYLADSMEAYQTHHHHHLVHNHQMSRTTESKPRLSKEEVDVLEAEFQKNHKPNSTVKKALAESMRVDNARINNWFQNRRAREKKERNIREYEARQKLEKEKSHSENGESPASGRNNDLVASSAPFPKTHAPARSQTGTPEGSDSPISRADAKECDGQVILPTTELSPRPSPEAVVKRESVDSTRFPYDSINDSELMVDGDLSPNAFSDTTEHEFMLSANAAEPGFFMSQLNQPSHDFHLAACEPSISEQKPSQVIDIAGRRNRRPPPLSINGSRSYTGGLKTAVDAGKRMEFGGHMRRVASATGPMRITKPTGTPRSPFFNRAASDAFNMRLSPVLPGIQGTNAPPTPDTPVVIATHPTESMVHTDSDSESSDRFSAPDVALHDPTLRTPPTTPGLMESYFSLNAVYDMQVGDGNLLNPNMNNYGGNLEVPAVSMAVPGYIANAPGCSSQPVTPSFSPNNNNAGYFGLPGANAEYQWPDHCSRTSSPVRGAQQTQFMNMTTSNFSPIER